MEVLESYFKYCNYLSVASASITFLFSLRLWGIETLHHIIRRVKIEKKNLFFFCSIIIFWMFIILSLFFADMNEFLETRFHKTLWSWKKPRAFKHQVGSIIS